MGERLTTVLLRLAGVAAAASVVIFMALTSGAGWLAAALYGGGVAVGVSFATLTGTTREKFSDAGRGLVVAILLTLVAYSISHRNEVRNARDSLRLTLSSGKIFTGIDLRGRNLKNAYIGGKHLSDADLRGADLANAVFRHSTLRNTDFHGSGTDLSDADLSYTDLSGSDFRSVRLNGADLTQANLRGARLAGADLRGATLNSANLDGADLREADLRSALLFGTHLQGALLNDADLRGAVLNGDLREADLRGAALKGVRTDSRTRWPDGFDLARAVAEALAPPSGKVKIPPDAGTDVVIGVADGDTIELRHLGHGRLVGIDAPTDEPRAACYGREATKALRQLLPAGASVRYTVGSTPEDAFHRKLAYLWLPGGTFVNERLVADGDATFLPQPHKAKLSDVERFYAKRMKRDGTRAAMAKRGLWGACSATED